MSRSRIVFLVSLLFFVIGLLILLDQYIQVGVWFQFADIHHETFALSSFALGIGILVGLLSSKTGE